MFEGKLIKQIRYSVWTFPLVLLVLLVLLSAFKISGSSVGTYHQRLYGKTASDPNLLYGKPQAIRSDEWLVATQMTIAQSKLGYPRVNTNMGNGQELTLKTEVPTKDWGAIFKPHNWSFFVLPLEHAFAFKWWLVMFALVLSTYFFTLRVLPVGKKFAVLFAVAIGLSPFELWWYQSGAFLAIAYGLTMAILAIRIVGDEPIRGIKSRPAARALHLTALVFLMACFALIIYPPFQIPIVLVLLFFGIGHILQKRRRENLSWRKLLPRIGVIALAGVMAVFIALAFVLTHPVPVKAQSNSVYPGHRISVGGDLKLLSTFNAFLMPVNQSFTRAESFISNQSENSNFILLLPFLMIPGVALMAIEWSRRRRIDWIFLSLHLVSAIFFVRVFTPYGEPVLKLLFSRVPSKRLIIGFGFVGIIQSLFLLKKLGELKFSRAKLDRISIIYGALCFAVLLAIGVYVRNHYPDFLNNPILIAGLAGFFALIIAAWTANRRTLAASLLLLFTLASSFRIMPLYIGLGELTRSDIVERMAAISSPNESWVTVGDDAPIFENFGLLAGRRSISGTQAYPNLDFWRQADGGQNEAAYNRQAHAFFTDGPLKRPIEVNTIGTFRVRFDCSEFILDNADFALSVHPLSQPCVKLVETVKYPEVTFYLSKIEGGKNE